MSQPKSYASTTYSSTTSLPSASSTISSTQIHQPLPPIRGRAPSQTDEYTLPATTFSAFVVGGNNSYTYNRKREISRHDHPARAAAQVPAHEHEQSRNADVVPILPQTTVPVDSNVVNHNKFHYHQKDRRRSIASRPATRDGFGGEAYLYDLDEDDLDVDDDIDRDDDEDGEDENEKGPLYSNRYKNNEDGRLAVFNGEQHHQQQSKATQLKSVFSSDYLYGDDDSSSERYANHKKESEPDRDQLYQQSQSQSQLQPRIHQSRSDSNFLTNNNNFNWNRNGNGSGSTNNITNKATKPTTAHQIRPNSRHYQHQQPRHYYNDNRIGSGNGNHHQPRGSVSNANAHWNHSNHSHSHLPNPQQRQQHPRSASSSAFYNTNSYANPTSPPSSLSRTRTTSRTSPPSAPPRVSSLLPPPRTSNTTTTNNPRIPLSIIDTSTTPISSIPEPVVLPATTKSNSNFNPNSDPVSTPTTLPSSNAVVQEGPTYAQFATSFLDPLNNISDQLSVSISISNTASALATDSGSGAASAGPGPGPRRSQSHSRASSIGAVGDSLRNLNRWSSSTASSRMSAWDYHHYQQQQAQQQKITSFARRMSVDSIGLLSQHSDSIPDSLPPNHSSPRKLSKRRPSEGTNASPKSRARAGSASAFASGLALGVGVAAGSVSIASLRPDPSSSPLQPFSAPPPNLPPIISLPPLDTNPESKLRLESPAPRAMSRASPGGLNTPNSVFASQHGNGEPQDYFWGDLTNPSRTASPATRANPAVLLPPAPVTRDRDVIPERRGHSRSRSAAKSSGDSTRARDRSSKPSQKAMLSKALSKANHAVQLDNEQNYGAAREAYIEACELLQQVLARTNGEDDRKKLEAIRRTYTSRIEELDGLLPVHPQGDKALPARPDSFDYHGVQMGLAGVDSQSDAATITISHRDESPNSLVSAQVSSHAMHRPSESVTTYSDFSRTADIDKGLRQPSFSRSPMRRNFEGSSLTIPRSDDFLPAPLSPRRPTSPARAPSPDHVVQRDFSLTSERERLAVTSDFRSHRRNLSHESASWLDPIDESGGSTASSVHSRSSSRVMRRHIRQPSGDTEAEFNAALDTAIEAAYDDGYEAMTYDEEDDDRIASSMRRVEIAKELVRETEREAAIETARERERQRQMSLSQASQTYGGDFFDANDSDEEEERMLEEMTKGYVMEDFTLGQKSKYQSSVPRESDSSGLTSRTWHSSMGSNPPTGTTTLSTVSEMIPPVNHHKASSPPSMPPPTQSLPQLPLNRPSSSTGVRNRRLSGQNTKQLKIETSKLGPPPTMPLPPITTSSAMQSKATGGFIAQQRQALSATSTRPGPFSMRAPTSPVRGIGPTDAIYPTSPPDGQDEDFRTGSPSSIQPGMRKNFSSSSLKSLRSRQLSTVSHVDDPDHSSMTPLSQEISNTSISRQPTMPTLPTPIAATFGEKISLTGPLGGLHLFDSDFHSPVSTHHHQQQNPDIPLPLEPCPSDPLLRPFWLMRALYQTLAHPRGGYISNRLFVPRDAWKVKGVKLRNVEDKVSQCDLLTAALLALARVDSTDADAVLVEMQNLETHLETVQAALIRKLGAEVGAQGMPAFKEEKESELPPVPRNNSVSGKGGAFSWRRLRSKGSAVNLASTHGVKASTSGGGTSAVTGIPERDLISPGGSMPSLPMVAHPSSRPAKRDVTSVKFDGPNANYMASLARLFDAAQAVDQIARQVDDPGLRHADKTQVGLELSTRHAAEFFGFYICRFVLTDLATLLDKFVKRGSEWVLS